MTLSHLRGQVLVWRSSCSTQCSSQLTKLLTLSLRVHPITLRKKLLWDARVSFYISLFTARSDRWGVGSLALPPPQMISKTSLLQRRGPPPPSTWPSICLLLVSKSPKYIWSSTYSENNWNKLFTFMVDKTESCVLEKHSNVSSAYIDKLFMLWFFQQDGWYCEVWIYIFLELQIEQVRTTGILCTYTKKN